MLIVEGIRKAPKNLRRWTDRWLFREGGQYNCAIARMAIGVALLLTITHNGNFTGMAFNWDGWVQGHSGAGWTPKGVIKLVDWLWGGPPPISLTFFLFWASVVSSVAMIVGLASPISQVTATISTVYVVSLQTSFGPYWSHAYNVQLLAAIAFMFSRRSGDVWSIDAFIRRVRGLPPRFEQGRYWWPVIFAELATAMFMFGAFFQKFRDTGVFWALSDNIRNSLVVTWFQYRSDPPDIALWIASDPIIWKTAGLLQLFAQSTTILAAFLVARPVFRLIFGAGFFAVEILALGHVFRFWHPFWFPLCLLSIDFEHFYRMAQGRRAQINDRLVGPLQLLFQRRIEAAEGCKKRVGTKLANASVLMFAVVFFGYYAANLFFRLGETHLNYPFSTMGFYSVTRDRPPYGMHHYYPIYTGRIDAYEKGSKEPLALWYREGALEDTIFRVNTIERLKKIHESYMKRASYGLYTSSPDPKLPFDLRPVVPEKVVYRGGLMAVPPFPEPPGMVDFHMGYRAVSDQNGFRALVARTIFDENRNQYYITIETEGFRDPTFTILTNSGGYEADSVISPEKIKGTWEGERFYIDQEFVKDFTLIDVTDPVLGVEERYYGSDVF